MPSLRVHKKYATPYLFSMDAVAVELQVTCPMTNLVVHAFTAPHRKHRTANTLAARFEISLLLRLGRQIHKKKDSRDASWKICDEKLDQRRVEALEKTHWKALSRHLLAWHLTKTSIAAPPRVLRFHVHQAHVALNPSFRTFCEYKKAFPELYCLEFRHNRSATHSYLLYSLLHIYRKTAHSQCFLVG